ncbi:transcription factor HY5-like isoform X2 [Aristolochia californica]|uniref:transcription factor HY5-like isoform X2 n=1 Tax=Aristolochia californica TaxID=171875 RepID=UPI0035D8A752
MSLPDPSGAAPCVDGSWKNVSCQLITVKNKVEESDEDPFTVPDVEARPSGTSKASAVRQVNGRGVAAKRKRGRNAVDREYKGLKRLLRNRVSAQQARERKKVYANDLESRAKELQDRSSELEEKISTLINENTMLRKVIMNSRAKVDESAEAHNDQSSKS